MDDILEEFADREREMGEKCGMFDWCEVVFVSYRWVDWDVLGYCFFLLLDGGDDDACEIGEV